MRKSLEQILKEYEEIEPTINSAYMISADELMEIARQARAKAEGQPPAYALYSGILTALNVGFMCGRSYGRNEERKKKQQKTQKQKTHRKVKA